MSRNRALGTPFQVQTVTASFTTDWLYDMYAVDAPLGFPVTVTLDPNAFVGDQVVVQDVGQNAGAQPIVIDASPGQALVGTIGNTISITADNGAILFTFDEAAQGWTFQPFAGFGGGGGIALENAGVPLAGGPFTTLNLEPGLTAANAGGGVANITAGGGNYVSSSQGVNAGIVHIHSGTLAVAVATPAVVVAAGQKVIVTVNAEFLGGLDNATISAQIWVDGAADQDVVVSQSIGGGSPSTFSRRFEFTDITVGSHNFQLALSFSGAAATVPVGTGTVLAEVVNA